MRTATKMAAAGILIGMLAVVAMADFQAPPDDCTGFWVADVGECGSWYTTFTYSGPGDITQFQFRIVPLGSPTQTFELGTLPPSPVPPAARPVELRPADLSKVMRAGWSSFTTPDLETAWISGPPVSPDAGSPKFNALDISFAEGSFSSGSPFVLQLQAYDLCTLETNEEFYYNGTTWSGAITNPDGIPQYNVPPLWDATCPIPEPVTMLGVMSGIGGVGAYIRKRHAQA